MRKSGESGSGPGSFGRIKQRGSFSMMSAELLPLDSSFSFALLEFHQGHTPQSLWASGSCIIPDQMMWVIITAPLTFDYPPICPPPTVVYSSFESFHYIAIYTTIPDIEARGFSRFISFVIFNQNRVLINSIRGHWCKLICDFLSELQNEALKIFIPQFTKYSASLLFHAQIHPELDGKVMELRQISEYLKIESEPINELSEAIPIENFTMQMINNDLRPLLDIIRMQDHMSDLDKLISAIPTDQSSINYKLYGKTVESPPLLNLGSLPIDLFQCEEPSLVKLVPGSIIYHLAYCLLTGRTLCIESPITDEVKTLVEHLLIFVPGRAQVHYCDLIDTADSLEWTIVVAPEIIDSDPANEQVGFYTRSNFYYRGPICSPESVIWKRLSAPRFVSEVTLLLFFKQRLKTLECAFIIEMMKWKLNVPNNENKMHLAITQAGMSVDDDEVYAYWVNTLANHHPGKPILLNRHSKAGIGYVADYSF